MNIDQLQRIQEWQQITREFSHLPPWLLASVAGVSRTHFYSICNGTFAPSAKALALFKRRSRQISQIFSVDAVREVLVQRLDAQLEHEVSISEHQREHLETLRRQRRMLEEV